jgi:hypothetical protein
MYRIYTLYEEDLSNKIIKWLHTGDPRMLVGENPKKVISILFFILFWGLFEWNCSSVIVNGID